MGKKPSQSSLKISKNSKKQQHPINNLIKNLRPKVYIIDSSNFKNLVQELTGNGNGNENSPVMVSSPPPPYAPTSLPVEEVRTIIDIEDRAYQENSLNFSFGSSTCFSTSSESPNLQYRLPEPMNYLLENSQNIEFSSQYGDIESLLFEMDQISNYTTDDPCYAMIHQELRVSDYNFSGLV
ncbi:Hypothetical predicted protein [Olea europaea subsp. europaea]|uniref:VQ domain-containing protein n=1 Tax=Olea europaea subsp. europaea TaxID=158383 RepID=A0A8S0Q6S6_OLEEU|nr:Hypothetical predicted protein [Olea europaea subsp. europaea]